VTERPGIALNISVHTTGGVEVAKSKFNVKQPVSRHVLIALILTQCHSPALAGNTDGGKCIVAGGTTDGRHIHFVLTKEGAENHAGNSSIGDRG